MQSGYPPAVVVLKFTPLEFETTQAKSLRLTISVKIYSVGV